MSDNPVQTSGVNDVFAYNELHLDSVERDGGSNDQPFFVLQPAFSEVMAVKLVGARIPFTYHVFNDGNNAFQLVPDVGGAPDTVHTVRVPVGNYSVATLVPALQAALSAVSPADAYTVSYDAAAGRLVVVADSGKPFALRFGTGDADRGISNPRIWLGFAGGDNLSDGDGRLAAPSVANLTGPNYLYLVSSALGGRVSRNLRVNGGAALEPLVLAAIPVTVNPWGVVIYQDPTTEYAFDFSMGQVQKVDLALVFGHTGQTVNMNGSPWSVTFQVLTQRDTSVARNVKTDLVGNKRLRVK